MEQQSYTGECPYDDEEPPTCTEGETFSGQVADSNDVCSGGCVATPDTRPPDAIGYGLTMSDGSPLPGWYGTYTYSGETCTVEPEAPPAENCLTDSSGNQYCYEPQDQNCGTINGEAVCVGQPDGCGTFNGVSMCPDDQGCYDMPSGSRVCPDGVQTPPAPDDGTPGQPADPDGEITDGDGNTFNYFGPGTVDGSTDETPEECPPGETCDGEGEEECPEGEDCGNWDGSGEMYDVPGPGDKLDQAKAELSNKISQIRGEAASMIGLWDATGEASLPSASAETSLGTVTISVQDYGGWVGMLRGILFFAVALGCFFIVLENGFGGDK
ncbi:MAG: hypothetical protein EVA65_16525 [Oceanococcus sp.]|nr:MAG: hypothetical protein EVA65_16525 [Oceanococcus sp.]